MSEKLVFILGAGASIPFGQPSGKELIKLVTQSLVFSPKRIYKQSSGRGGGLASLVPDFEYDDSVSENILLEMISDAGFEYEEIERFRQSLMKSQINSVDAFLEHRNEFIPIGKMAIAYNLIQREVFSEQIFEEKPDWYNYLWNKLVTRIDEFPKNNLSIITFNYDRSLEHFLHTSFKSLYGLDDNESQTALNKIDIIHLHGTLGNLPWQGGDNKVEFGAKIFESTQLQKISENIKIIHEDISNNTEFQRGFEIMSEASKIYFLGFGYNQTNIDRLRLSSLPHLIQGTSIGLTENERSQIQRLNPNIILKGYRVMGCLDFLKEIVDFK